MPDINIYQPDRGENAYDDGNIPEIDYPKKDEIKEPLPEYTRPRHDGPGGE